MSISRVARRALCSTILAGAAAIVVGGPSWAADVTNTRLENADTEPQNWLLPYHDYQGHMFSSLDQINRDTVKNLKVAFTLPMASALSGNPDLNLMNFGLVDGGYLYIDDGRGGIYKVDLTSNDKAAVVWKADAAVSPDESNRTRGMALYGNAVYANLTDGRVVAVDRDTGEFLWDKQIARVPHEGGSGVNIKGEYFDAAPLPVDGKILVGNSYGDGLTRGWLEALDPSNGDDLWRTYMVPGPGEPGHETWKDDHEVWRIGGAGLWTTGTYDPKLHLTFWGTGNPQPMFDPAYRPGDNLYANSILAMNPDDGAIKWYFQYLPNESWDYDENGVHMVINAPIDGQDQTILGHWGRNGFFYRFAASDGQFMSTDQYVDKVTWTAGIDQKTGKPVEYDPSKDVQTYIPDTRPMPGQPPKTFCPTYIGGVRWQSVAYNPNTYLAYESSRDGCSVVQSAESKQMADSAMIDPNGPGGIRGRNNDATKALEVHGLVAAADVRTGKVVARTTYPYESQSGALVTGGGLVFTAYVDGHVAALNSDSLSEVWHFNTGVTTKAPPFTFSVNGKQYLAIFAGGGRRAAGYTGDYPEAANWVNGPVLYFFSL